MKIFNFSVKLFLLLLSLLVFSCSNENSVSPAKYKELEDKVAFQKNVIDALENRIRHTEELALSLQKGQMTGSEQGISNEQLRNIQERLDRQESAINQVYRIASAADNNAHQASNPLNIH